jgi:4-amino-4-deoxy-L-arabinose transferase-like glycosyltransferase
VAVAVVATLGVFRLLYHLAYRDWFVDELTYRSAADRIRRGRFFTNPQHPPLAKEIMAAFQAVLGSSPERTRIVTVLVVAATGVVLFLLGRELAGRWAGLAAAAMLVLIAWPTPQWDVERLALLDPYMALGTTAALYGAVRWWRTGRWRWALVTGIALGAATACKLPGVLMAPAAFGLPLVATRFSRTTLLQAVGAGAAAVVAFAIPFAPAGTYAFHRMWLTIAHQSENSDEGHNVIVAGHVYAHPPWWTGPWEIFHGNVALALLLGACLVAAPFVLEHLVAAFLMTAVLVPVIFFGFVSGVQLPHYPYAYAAASALLIGVVVVEMAHERRARFIAPVLAGLAVIAIAVSVRHTARQTTGDAQKVVAMLRPYLSHGTAVAGATPHGVIGAYLPAGSQQIVVNRNNARVVAVVTDPAWIAVNPAKRKLREQWQQAIAGRRPVNVGEYQVYVL